jgi:hypothetical protein
VLRLGLLLIAAAVVLLLADWGGLSRRMPTQVPPSRFALVPLVGGVLLVAFALARP